MTDQTPTRPGAFTGTREEAIACLLLLECRLEIDRVYEASAEHEGRDYRMLERAERDQMLAEGLDGIACRDETIRQLQDQLAERRRARLGTDALLGRLAVMLGQKRPHDEILAILTAADGDAQALADHRREARVQGWLLGFRDAHDLAASMTIRAGGQEIKPSRDDVMDALKRQIDRFMARSGCSARPEGLSFHDHLMMLAKIGAGLTGEERRALAVHDRAEAEMEG